MLIEGVLIAVALACGVWVRFWNHPEDIRINVHFPDIAFQTLTIILTFLVCSYDSDRYNLTVFRRRSDQLISLGQSLGPACLLLGALYYVFPGLLIGRGVFLISVFLVAGLVT